MSLNPDRTLTTPSDAPGATRPIHRNVAPPLGYIDPDDTLVLPLSKRIVTQYATNESGAKELRLFYDDKEISFDEPELFGFGETLAKQSRFVAREAVRWGEGVDWIRVQELLRQLILAGVLIHADDFDLRGDDALGGTRPSPLPPAETAVARTWNDECEAVTRDLTGRPLELGYLELVVPIFRVAHMSLDADGRQIGEANVFPPALRLDVPTNWRACIYPGTRHMDKRPMNVTALKAMRAHWPQMMAALLPIRNAYLRRFPDAATGWTVGHLERLSTAVLAVPTFQLMRRDAPMINGSLHPALSSLFRVTDGVRMTMHQMLFIPIGEPTSQPDDAMDAAGILAYAERNYSFHSDFGVCAGPKAMMEEFLSVLVDGHPARGSESFAFDPEVAAALADVDASLDYGLLGLQTYAGVFSLWPIMTRTYERLWTIVESWLAAGGPPAVAALADHMRGIMESLKSVTYLGTEQWRVDREKVYADMYRQCGRGLGGTVMTLTERIAAHRDDALLEIERRVNELMKRYFAPRTQTDSRYLVEFTTAVVDYYSQEQSILRVAVATQERINALLHRPAPHRAFTAAEIDIHVLLQGRRGRQVPYLGSELASIFGFRVTIDKDDIVLADNA